MDLSIIIVNWNTRDLLQQCLLSIQENVETCEPANVETFVVDNASTDGSTAMVRERFPWVGLIKSPENVGFAAGNNLALRRATGNYLLLLNPDTVVPPGALSRLQDVLTARADAGIAGAQLLNADGSLQKSYGVFPGLWAELPLVNRRLHGVRATPQVSLPDTSLTVQSVDWVSGACLMIKKEVYEAIGPLDESFWLYTEETDWCYRARRAGWDVLFVPQAQVYHVARAASRQRFVTTMLHFYQSKVRFVRKHHGWLHASLVRNVLQAKALIWRQRPSRSPLHGAYPDLPLADISAAYRQLSRALAQPLPDYLAESWR